MLQYNIYTNNYMNYLQTIALLEMVCITFQYKVYKACLTSSDVMDSFYYVECIDDYAMLLLMVS